MKCKSILISIIGVFVFSFGFGNLANAESVAISDEWLHSDETELSAHRGAHVAVPENTAEAIKWAGMLEYGFVEIDIQETKDGQYVLMHDANIDRTTTGSGKIEDLTLEEIKSYNVVNADGKETNYKVPTLEEALQEADKYDVGINFDGSKGEWDDKEFVDDVVEIARENNVLDHSFFVLSNQDIRDQFNAWYPEATVTFLGNALNDLEEDIQELKKYDSAIYTTSINNIDKAAAEKIDEEGLKIHVYQVNSAETYAKSMEIEPRLIETDVIVPGGIDHLVELIDQLRKEEGITEDETAHLFKLHLKAVKQFEDAGKNDKAMKHMESFKGMIDFHEENNWITETTSNTLKVNTDKQINKWK